MPEPTPRPAFDPETEEWIYPPTPRPADVPDELVARMLEAALDVCVDMDSWAARRLLAAVLPEIERQVRERVAAEIEDPSVWPDHFGAWTAEQAEAARTMKAYILAKIARGGA